MTQRKRIKTPSLVLLVELLIHNKLLDLAFRHSTRIESRQSVSLNQSDTLNVAIESKHFATALFF